MLSPVPRYELDPTQLLESARVVTKLLQPAADIFRMLGPIGTTRYFRQNSEDLSSSSQTNVNIDEKATS